MQKMPRSRMVRLSAGKAISELTLLACAMLTSPAFNGCPNTELLS